MTLHAGEEAGPEYHVCEMLGLNIEARRPGAL